jgi:ABC-type transport system substrate-binding protein
MERGDADLSVDMPFKDAAEIKKCRAYRVVGTPVENSLQYVGLVIKMKPFDDVRVRQAIARALPYEEIYKRVVYDICVPMSGAPTGAPTSAAWPRPVPYGGHGKSQAAADRGRLWRRLRDVDLHRSPRCHAIGAHRGAAAGQDNKLVKEPPDD